MPEVSSPLLGRRLDGWDEIASHIGKTARTAQRWGRELALPVHHISGERSRVYAFATELDAWLAGRPTLELSPPIAQNDRAVRSRVGLWVGATLLLVSEIAGFGLGLNRPDVTEVSPILAGEHQSVAIHGKGLGTMTGGLGIAPPYIEIYDTTAGWRTATVAPTQGVTLDIAEWDNNEIDLAGFAGAYGQSGRVLHAGDLVVISVWNPQTHLGPSRISVRVQAHAMQPTIPFIPWQANLNP